MTSSPSEITALLNAADDGSQEALCSLWNAVQQEVRAMAGLLIAREPNSADLQPTLVMNEVFLRMNARDELAPLWESRQHFFGCVWRVMRQFLIDYARTRRRVKRGGGCRPLDLEVAAGELSRLQNITIDSEQLLEALDRLRDASPRQHEVLWRRFALDQTVDQVAAAMELSPRTAAEDWRYAKTWLRRELACDRRHA